MKLFGKIVLGVFLSGVITTSEIILLASSWDDTCQKIITTITTPGTWIILCLSALGLFLLGVSVMPKNQTEPQPTGNQKKTG